MATIGRIARSSTIWKSVAMNSRVEKQLVEAHRVRVSLRPIFAILIAFAMLFSPFAMRTGSAMAAMSSDHHSQMMAKAHCGEQPSSGTADKTHTKSCCVAMCSAIAVAPASPAEPLAFARAMERPAREQSPHGYLANLATPPPRAL